MKSTDFEISFMHGWRSEVNWRKISFTEGQFGNREVEQSESLGLVGFLPAS